MSNAADSPWSIGLTHPPRLSPFFGNQLPTVTKIIGNTLENMPCPAGKELFVVLLLDNKGREFALHNDHEAYPLQAYSTDPLPFGELFWQFSTLPDANEPGLFHRTIASLCQVPLGKARFTRAYICQVTMQPALRLVELAQRAVVHLVPSLHEATGELIPASRKSLFKHLLQEELSIIATPTHTHWSGNAQMMEEWAGETLCCLPLAALADHGPLTQQFALDETVTCPTCRINLATYRRNLTTTTHGQSH